MTSRRQDPEPPSAQRFDEEYRALEASLREYLDRRLTLLSADEEMDETRPEGWFRRWRIDLYFAVTIVLLGLIWWRLAAPAPPGPAAPEPASAVESPPSEPEPETGGTPAERAAEGEPPAREAGDAPAPEPAAAGEEPAGGAEPEPAAEPPP